MIITLSQLPPQHCLLVKKNGDRFSYLKLANYCSNSWAAKHFVKDGRASTTLQITYFIKMKSVACVQAPFFRVEEKVSLESPIRDLCILARQYTFFLTNRGVLQT